MLLFKFAILMLWDTIAFNYSVFRAAAVFNVDEIVVYEDGGKSNIDTEQQM